MLRAKKQAMQNRCPVGKRSKHRTRVSRVANLLLVAILVGLLRLLISSIAVGAVGVGPLVLPAALEQELAQDAERIGRPIVKENHILSVYS